MEDYLFFGSHHRWQPSEIDNMSWAMRKQLKQVIEDTKD